MIGIDLKPVAEALRQVRDGRDFASPRQILNRIPAERACVRLEPFGYSLAAYVLHADFWQQTWLRKLKGVPGPRMLDDWREPDPSEWREVRSQFLMRLDEAVAFAEARPFCHKVRTNEEAVATLFRIAIHNSYHIGQIVLLKRALRSEVRYSE